VPPDPAEVLEESLMQPLPTTTTTDPDLAELITRMDEAADAYIAATSGATSNSSRTPQTAR